MPALFIYAFGLQFLRAGFLPEDATIRASADTGVDDQRAANRLSSTAIDDDSGRPWTSVFATSGVAHKASHWAIQPSGSGHS